MPYTVFIYCVRVNTVNQIYPSPPSSNRIIAPDRHKLFAGKKSLKKNQLSDGDTCSLNRRRLKRHLTDLVFENVDVFTGACALAKCLRYNSFVVEQVNTREIREEKNGPLRYSFVNRKKRIWEKNENARASFEIPLYRCDIFFASV